MRWRSISAGVQFARFEGCGQKADRSSDGRAGYILSTNLFTSTRSPSMPMIASGWAVGATQWNKWKCFSIWRRILNEIVVNLDFVGWAGWNFQLKKRKQTTPLLDEVQWNSVIRMDFMPLILKRLGGFPETFSKTNGINAKFVLQTFEISSVSCQLEGDWLSCRISNDSS